MSLDETRSMFESSLRESVSFILFVLKVPFLTLTENIRSLCFLLKYLASCFSSSKSWLGNMETWNVWETKDLKWIELNSRMKKHNTGIEMMRYCGFIVVSSLAFSLGWMNCHGNDDVHQSEELLMFSERVVFNERILNFLKGLLHSSLIRKLLSTQNLQGFPKQDKPKKQV